MRKYSYGLFAGLASVAFIIIVIGNITIVAQNAVTGTWKSDSWSDKRTDKHKSGDDDPLDNTSLKKDENKLHLSFSRNTDGGNRNQFGSGFDYADLQGLTREQTQNGNVRFRIVREAGTVECEGTFTNGKGSGTFRFTPNMSYVEGMKARGFDFEKAASKRDDGVEERLLSAALINVTTALADDLKSVGFGNLDVDDLFKAAIFKIDSKFMAEMKATGFPDLTMEDLVKARIFKIDAEYVRQVNNMGFAEKDFEKLVKFRIFKVTPEFLSEIKAEGLTELDSEDIVKLRILKIGAEYIRRAKQQDPNVTVEELVQMKIGVHRIKVKDDN